MSNTLSKSKYLAGLHCTKRLWFEIHEPVEVAADAGTELRFTAGDEAGDAARAARPEGVFIEFENSVQRTSEAVAQGATRLYEASFFYNGVYVRADIIEKQPNGRWHLIEVKSSTSVKNEHYPDVAIQVYAMRGAGYGVARVSIMHLNRDCRYPDLTHLFTLTDVSAEVKALQDQTAENVQRFLSVLNEASPPEVLIGNHCTSCAFRERCWKGVPSPSIFDIPYLKPAKKAALASQGIFALGDIPASFELSKNQQAFVTASGKQETVIDAEPIRALLKPLQFPLHFLDFETCAYPVPRYDGTNPYYQLPFQFSCHILQADGTLTHDAYLHTDKSDPRKVVAEKVAACIGKTGSVIAYNAAFERARLFELADAAPQHAEALRSMAARLFDPLEIFKKHYRHADFMSNSLKDVLPVLVPSMGYSELAVKNGDEALLAWQQILNEENQVRREELAAALNAYCKHDTRAMVELHRILSAL